MHRKASRRVLTTFAGLASMLALAGCKPDIPLIPFVKGDAAPGRATAHADSLAYPAGPMKLLIDPD